MKERQGIMKLNMGKEAGVQCDKLENETIKIKICEITAAEEGHKDNIFFL